MTRFHFDFGNLAAVTLTMGIETLDIGNSVSWTLKALQVEL